MTEAAIIVFTGPFRGRASIAREIARWLVAPSLYIQSIIDGLILHPCNKKTEDFLEGLLSPTVGVLHEGEEEQQKLVRTALRMVFSQLPLLARTMNNRNSCIVLELPWCSRTLVEMFMKFLDDRRISNNENRIDRGVIVKCMAREDVSTRQWIQTEEREMYRGVFCYPDYYKKGSTTDWDCIEKVIVQRLQMISSKFDEQDRGELMNLTAVSELEMDPVHDIINLGELRITEDRHEMPGNFYRALTWLAFEIESIPPPADTVTARNFQKFVRDNIYVARVESAPCFSGEEDHIFAYTTKLQNQSLTGQLSCRICSKLVTDSASSYSCMYCKLEMHQVCAEMADIPSPPAPADKFDEWFCFLKQCDDGDHKHIDNKLTAACPSCNAMERPFSLDCNACRFDFFLNNRILPVIVPHPLLDPEFFTIKITGWTRKTDENCIPCAACGEPIRAGISYHSDSSLFYGFACIALLPLEITEPEQNNHHGHHHPLKLRDKPYQEYENYICDVCWQERDPRHWHYYCEECDFSCHVYCSCTYDRHRH